MNYATLVKLFKTSELISVYNRYSEAPLRKFTDRKAGEARTVKVLTDSNVTYAHLLENPAISVLTKEAIAKQQAKEAPPKLTVAVAIPKKPAAPEAKPKRKYGMFKGKKIYKLSKAMPYRKGSRKETCWNLLKDGMTFEEFKKTRHPIFDLRMAVNDGYVELRE